MGVSSKEVARRRAPGKGLRHFAMSVLLKVEKKGRTSYNEVADELLQDVANDYHQARAPQVDNCVVVYDISNSSI